MLPTTRRTPERVDIIAITHGHGDHVGDTVDSGKSTSRSSSLRSSSPTGLEAWSTRREERPRPEQGRHRRRRRASSSRSRTPTTRARTAPRGLVYSGEPVGIVSTLEDGTADLLRRRHVRLRRHAADRRLYEPDVAVLPIGDHYTMGPREAAVALELLGAKRCVPCHWGTFPRLTGTPAALRELAPAGVEIVDVEPGGTSSYEGALARRRPGAGARDRRRGRARPPADALVLDDVARPGRLAQAHAAGQPVVVARRGGERRERRRSPIPRSPACSCQRNTATCSISTSPS